MSAPTRLPRLLVLLLAACLAAAGLAVTAVAPATAAPVIQGRIIDVTTGNPLRGFSVRLITNNGGSPGTVVDTAATNAEGYFVLDAPPRRGGYYVQHQAGTYQAGWVGGPAGDRYVQERFANGDVYAAGAKLGRIYALPAFIRGIVVDSGTNQRVAGVKVTARSANNLASVEAAATTDRLGRFTLTGIDFEDDGALRFNGQSVGHEIGYLACDFTVVGTWGDACATPIGVLSTTVKLDGTVM